MDSRIDLIEILTDRDGDGYGNRCDTDFNNDNVTNFGDLVYMKSVWLSSDPEADLNGDGTVDFDDLIIMKSMWLQPSGPSGLQNISALLATYICPDYPIIYVFALNHKASSVKKAVHNPVIG